MGYKVAKLAPDVVRRLAKNFVEERQEASETPSGRRKGRAVGTLAGEKGKGFGGNCSNKRLFTEVLVWRGFHSVWFYIMIWFRIILYWYFFSEYCEKCW